MDSDFDPEKSEAFITAARTRQFLTDDQAETLRRESTERSLSAAYLAIESGMMRPAEAEIAEAFAAPKDLAPGYELLDVLGYGALGVVYRAHQPHLRRDVAVKAIMQNRLVEQNVFARFQQEGAAIGRLHHPNIVSAIDSGTHGQRLYLVMELVRGIDLRERLEQQGAMDVVTALSIVRQTALGLANALAQQIIHRDIKPGNLMLTDAPAGFDLPPGVPLVKITDFGLARLNIQADVDDATRLTIAGTAMGTPMYCAPEQLAGDAVDHRADIYALGATLVNMLAGRPPYKESKVSKLITAKLTGQNYDVDVLPDHLPTEVIALLDRMLAHDPSERIDSYESLIETIDKILGSIASSNGSPAPSQGPPTSLPSSLPTQRTTTVKRSTIISVIVVALASMLATVVIGLQLFAEAEPTLEPSGWEQHLFDGTSVQFLSSRGLWRSGRDSEGGVILEGSGSGAKSLPLPPSPAEGMESAVAMRVGVNLRDADAAEIHFGFNGMDFDNSPRLVVRFARENITLGRREGVEGELTQLSTPVPSPKPRDTDGPTYHEIKIELHERNWFVFFDDRRLGTIRANPKGANRFVQLVAPSGTVHFEGLSSFGLQKKTEQEKD